MTVADAKWLYDYVPTGTPIKIKQGNSKKPGPLGKPATIKVTGSIHYDPTDPEVPNSRKKADYKANRISGYMTKSGKKVAAICAAPSVLASLGLLEGRKATAHAGFQDKLAAYMVPKSSLQPARPEAFEAFLEERTGCTRENVPSFVTLRALRRSAGVLFHKG